MVTETTEITEKLKRIVCLKHFEYKGTFFRFLKHVHPLFKI